MALKKTPADNGEINVVRVETGTLTVALVGTTPMIFNSMNKHIMEALLLPPVKKKRAELESSLKHDPMSEFRRSPTKIDDPKAPTLLAVLSTAVKGALRTAALDLPGATKAQIGRLTYVHGERVPVYGVPKLLCSVVRNSDPGRTPDVRTRCIVPRWAAIASITFSKPQLRETAVANLMAAAGLTVGIGDWRPEKGSGNFGQFRLAGVDDAELKEIMAEGGRSAQEEAMASPECYDSDTEELLSWFNAEVRRRGFKVAA